MPPGAYRVVVEGELSGRYAAAFAPMCIEMQGGNTALVGPIQDQAELQGLLDNICSLGLALVSVTPIDLPSD
jgi:hypothetical protein